MNLGIQIQLDSYLNGLICNSDIKIFTSTDRDTLINNMLNIEDVEISLKEKLEYLHALEEFISKCRIKAVVLPEDLDIYPSKELFILYAIKLGSFGINMVSAQVNRELQENITFEFRSRLVEKIQKIEQLIKEEDENSRTSEVPNGEGIQTGSSNIDDIVDSSSGNGDQE